MDEAPIRVTIIPANQRISMKTVEPASVPVDVVALLAPVAEALEFPTDPLAYYILAKG